MAKTFARSYLFLLTFLHTFSMLLCVSTYYNHGLLTNQNFEVSVRSRTKRDVIPEIIHSNRHRHKKTRTKIKPLNLEKFCSSHHSHVFCQKVGRNRVKRTIHSSASYQLRTGAIPNAFTSNSGGLLNSQINIADLRISILQNFQQQSSNQLGTNLFTNHDRQPETTPDSSTLVTTTPTTTVTTARLTRHNHSISDHHAESPNSNDPDCPAGYCRDGVCHFDYIRQSPTCL